MLILYKDSRRANTTLPMWTSMSTLGMALLSMVLTVAHVEMSMSRGPTRDINIL